MSKQPPPLRRRGRSSDSFEPPTAQEIMEHGRYLGLDPVYDLPLLWIAEESLCAALPAFWDDHTDEQGNVYYRNRRTGETSRHHPLDMKYMKRVIQAKNPSTEAEPGPVYRGQSTVASQPRGLKQQYYQEMLAKVPGADGKYEAQVGKSSSKQSGGFFSSLKQLAGCGSRKQRKSVENEDLANALQLVQKVEERAVNRAKVQERANSRANATKTGKAPRVPP